MEKFKPSIDWGHEIVRSALWILGAWAVCAVCRAGDRGPVDPLHHVGTTVLAHHRRLLHRCGERCRSGALLAVMLLSVMVEVRIQVLLSYYSNDVYSALQVGVPGRRRAQRRAAQFRHPRLLDGAR